MDTWSADYDKDGTMHTWTEDKTKTMLVTRSPIYAHQLAPHEIGVVARVGNKCIGTKIDVRQYAGNGKAMSANEQAFIAGKSAAYDLLKQLENN